MKMTDIRKMNDKELAKKLSTLKSEVVSLKRDKFTTDEKNMNKARGIKRDIARLLTEQTERQNNPTVDQKES